VVQTPTKPITLEEFLKLPETKPASEYVDGEIIQKPIPKGRHSIIQIELGSKINVALRKQGITTAFTELRCTFGNRSVVPDVAVFEDSRIPYTDNGEIADIFTAAPDWTIEILSPDQRRARVLKNIRHCLDHGTQMGWLIDPEDQSVFIGQIGQQFTIIDEPDLPLPVTEFAADLKLTVGEIFGWLKRK
jgi:Uma2 family endonuclease